MFFCSKTGSVGRPTDPDFFGDPDLDPDFFQIYWVVAEIRPDGFFTIPDLVQTWSRVGPDQGTWLSRFWAGPDLIFTKTIPIF